MGRRIAYIRVSTDEQRPDRQINALRANSDSLEIEHGVSATSKHRPVLNTVIRDLRSDDTLVVSSVDRAFRSTTHAAATLEDLLDRGVRVLILELGMDTATPTGRLLYRIMAALAEFEIDTLSDRTKQGLEAARRRGIKLGRPRKLDKVAITEIRKTLACDPSLSLDRIAERHDCSRRTVHRALQRGAYE